MEKRQKKIGVLDSGLGGLTVVKELTRLLPEESIAYFGDNKNCPYGNRTQEEILKLSTTMLDFLMDKEIKIAAVACNTISTQIDRLREHCKIPLVSIIEAACEHVAARNYTQVGIIATEFTIKQGLYGMLIKKQRSETQVFGQASRTLAALVDGGKFNDPETKAEVKAVLNALLKTHPELKHIILGCTHYPLLIDCIRDIVGPVRIINAAESTARKLKTFLSLNEMENCGHKSEGHSFYVSDNTRKFSRICNLILHQNFEAVKIDLEDI